MNPEYMGGRRSDRRPTVTSIWLEGRSSLPSINLTASLEASFDIVFGLFGIGRNATPSEIIINKLATNRFQPVTILNKLSGKALTVEDSSTNQGARIQQVTRIALERRPDALRGVFQPLNQREFTLNALKLSNLDSPEPDNSDTFVSSPRTAVGKPSGARLPGATLCS